MNLRNQLATLLDRTAGRKDQDVDALDTVVFFIDNNFLKIEEC